MSVSTAIGNALHRRQYSINPKNLPYVRYFANLRQNARQDGKHQLAAAFSKIIGSIMRYPLPITSGQQALLLDGVGRFFSSYFEKVREEKAKEFEDVHTLQLRKFLRVTLQEADAFAGKSYIPAVRDTPLSHISRQSDGSSIPLTPDGDATKTLPSSIDQDARVYKPSTGSSPWTILASMYIYGHIFHEECMRKRDIKKASLKLAEFVKCTITTWSALKTLVTRSLIESSTSLIGSLLSSSAIPSTPHASGRSRSLHSNTPSIFYRLTPLGRQTAMVCVRTTAVPIASVAPLTFSQESIDLPHHASQEPAAAKELTSTAPMPLLKRNERNLESSKEQERVCLLTSNNAETDTLHTNIFPLSLLQAEKCSSRMSLASSIVETALPHSIDSTGIAYSQSKCFLPSSTPTAVHATTLDDANGAWVPPTAAVCALEVKTKNTSRQGETKTSVRKQPQLLSAETSVKKQPKQATLGIETSNISSKSKMVTLSDSGIPKALLPKSLAFTFPVEQKRDYAAAIELILLVDCRELRNTRKKSNLNEGLSRNGVNLELRQLPIGDISWICRRRVCESSLIGKSKDLPVYDQWVLPWIVERKSLTDLSASIMDGRYDEQKYRLLRSPGIENVIYLLEATPSEGFDAAMPFCNNYRLPIATIQSAQLNTQFVTGFTTLWTQSTAHTISILTRLHRRVNEHLFKVAQVDSSLDETAKSDQLMKWLNTNRPQWDAWMHLTKKSASSTLQEIFGKQLRVVSKCGPEATEALLELWPTPSKLIGALNEYVVDAHLVDHIKERWMYRRGKGKHFKNFRIPVNAQLVHRCREIFAPNTISDTGCNDEACLSQTAEVLNTASV